jgi:FkbM family methyltransferase
MATHASPPILNHTPMISRMARFANDCYHVLRAPTGSKVSILRSLILSNGRKMGFRVASFDVHTLKHLYREIFVRQHYYFHCDSHTPVILDCGANLGMASLYFKWLYPEARIVAFEPDPETFQLLAKNIARNGLDIQAHNCALWDQDGELNFFVDDREPGSLLMSAYSSRTNGKCITVPARKLSGFIEGQVDFLKIDVEGSEQRILEELVGSGKIANIRQMVVEYHHRIAHHKSNLAEFLRLLEQAGFEYQIHGVLYPVTAKHYFQDLLIGAYR